MGRHQGRRHKEKRTRQKETAVSLCLCNATLCLAYLASAPAACFLRWSQLYLRWNFSTRPVVSTYFILPVKNGWHAEQISTAIFFLVLRVTNLLPQPHVTVVSSYLGWMSFFMIATESKC